MKSISWLILGLLTLGCCAASPAQLVDGQSMPQQPGHHWLQFTAQLGGRPTRLDYIIYLPRGYESSSKAWPMLLFLHGNGDQATNLSNAFKWGPGRELEMPGNERFRDSFPFVVLYPQCPPRGQRWDQPEMVQAVIALLDASLHWLKVDPQRISLTGLSMGGTGSWHVALAAPDRFAAIGEFAGMAVRPDEAAQKLKDVAIWGITGADDPGPTEGNRQMAAALRAAGGSMKLTAVPNAGHSVQQPFYASPQWYEWLLTHRRGLPRPPTSIPQTPGHYELEFETQVDGQLIQLSYTISLPPAYTPSGEARPLLVFLHDEGTFGTEVGGRYLHGPELAMAQGKIPSLPFILLSPRCPPTFHWGQPQTNQAVLLLIDAVSHQLRVDSRRIYLTGLNAAAAGLWGIAAQAPTRLAAIAPVVTRTPFTPPPPAAAGLRSLPVLAVCAHQTVAQAQAALGKDRTDTTCTSLSPEEADGAAPGYASPRLYEWLLRHQAK